MTKIVRALLFVALMAPGVCLAQNAPDPKAWASRFFGVLVAEGAEKATQLLILESFVGQQNPAAMKEVGKSMATAFSVHGDALGFELVNEKAIGSSLLVLTYVVKHEKRPVLWKLAFYKPGSGWNLNNFKFFDNLGEIPGFLSR